MHRLSGTDSGFLAMEAPWQPMFNVTHAVLAPGPALGLDDLVAHLAGRLDQLPAFRQRVVPVPGGLHHPVALDDPAFVLADHVGHVDLADPAWAGHDLDRLSAALAAEPMPTDRPLWRAWLVDGVGGGRQAVVVHFHHAIADGTAAIAMMRRVFGDAELGPVVGGGPYAPQRVPGRARLVAAALGAHLASVLRFLAAVLGVVGGVRRLKERRAEADVEVPDISGGAPRTPLNEAFTPGRTATTVRLPIDGLRHVRRATGATLNDVVLAVVSGAVREHLLALGELPERPLLCNVPVADPAPDAPERTSGNDFWSVTTTLATDVADPLERLRTIGAVTAECKERLRIFGVRTVPALLDVVPPRLLARGTRRVGERLREAADVDANVLVSNVRGEATPLRLGGREAEQMYVCGPPSNGIGLNISVMSYVDTMAVMVLAYADALPDAPAFGRRVEDSFAELAALTGWAEPGRAAG